MALEKENYYSLVCHRSNISQPRRSMSRREFRWFIYIHYVCVSWRDHFDIKTLQSNRSTYLRLATVIYPCSLLCHNIVLIFYMAWDLILEYVNQSLSKNFYKSQPALEHGKENLFLKLKAFFLCVSLWQQTRLIR